MNNFEYLIHQVETQATEKNIAPNKLISCLDLTSLNFQDNEDSIEKLCEKALQYNVAAVCVYPAFVEYCHALLKNHSTLKIATVINFPAGDQDLSTILKSIEKNLNNGAQEFDIVIPYQKFLETHDRLFLKNFVAQCKSLLPHYSLKMILETGAFHDKQLLENAALSCLEGGANMLKTSTGKISQGASLMTAAILLSAIQRFGDMTRGFKASGGVKHYSQAKMYFGLAQMMIGESWPTPATFRIGASSLLDELIEVA